MGAQQVLRDARLTGRGLLTVTLALALLCVTYAPGPVYAQTPADRDTKPRRARDAAEPVVLIDVRSDAANAPERAASRTALLAAIERSTEITAKATDDPELLAALSGQLRPALTRERDGAAEHVRAAGAAFGQLDCPAAESAARRAITALAGLRAVTPDSDAISGHLTRAYVYLLLCAHNRGDSDGAMRARGLLEKLPPAGQVMSKPDGVSDLVWNLYPPLDATVNTPMYEVEVKTEPADATVWVDYARVQAGSGGVTKVLLPQGRHLVAAALGERHHAVAADIAGEGQVVQLTLKDKPKESPYLDISQVVADWQRADRQPSGEEIAAVLGQVGARFAFIIAADASTGPTASGDAARDIIAVWALAPGERAARPLLTEPTTRLADIGQAVRIRSLGWRRPGPEPGVPLLRETRKRPTGRRDLEKKPKWWVYATIVGAVAVGATLVLASDLADNRQRIEVTW